MTTKTQQILALLDHGRHTTRAIAERVGCLPEYVRTVRARRSAGGLRECDLKWNAGGRRDYYNRKRAERMTAEA